MAPTDPEVKAILAQEAAAAGEQLLWWGRPAGRRLALQSLPASFVGVPFTSFALFWMWAASGGLSRGRPESGPFRFFALFGLPFVAVGAGLLLAPLFALLGARRTLYAVTTGSVLVVKVGRSRRVERHPLPGDGVLARTQRPDGSGDLVVGRAETATARGRSVTRAVTFVGIPEVARVERIIADARRSHAEGQLAPSLSPPPSAPAAVRPPFRDGARLPPGGTEERRLPALFVLTVGIVIGLAVALLLARAGKLPGAIAPVPAVVAPATPGLATTRPAPGPTPPSGSTARVASPAVDAAVGGEPACDTGDGAACLRAARERYERGARAPSEPGSLGDRRAGAALAVRGCDLGVAAACGYAAWILSGNGGVQLTDRRAALRSAERGCALGDGGCCTARDQLIRDLP